MEAKDHFNETEIRKIEKLKHLAKGYMNGVIHGYGLIYESFLVMAGGAFTAWHHNEDPRDFDIFVLSPGLDQADPVKAEIQAMLRQGIKDSDLEINANAAYMGNPNIVSVWKDNNNRAQFIFTKYKTRKELLDHFDFQHCKVAYTPTTGNLYISPLTYHCMDKKLLLKNPTGIEIQYWRLAKFQKRGFDISKVTLDMSTIRPFSTTPMPAVHVKQTATAGQNAHWQRELEAMKSLFSTVIKR